MKKKRGSGSFNVVQWARTKPATNGGNRCATCRRPKIAAVVLKIVRMREREETMVTNVEIAQMLGERYEFSIGSNSLSRHISKCIYGKASS